MCSDLERVQHGGDGCPFKIFKGCVCAISQTLTQATYDTAKAELELGIAGVQKALGVLRDYYGGAAFVQKGFDAFMQQPAPPKKHSASGGAGGSIIDILEVCESDFAKNLATEETEEADAVATYEKTTQEVSCLLSQCSCECSAP